MSAPGVPSPDMCSPSVGQVRSDRGQPPLTHCVGIGQTPRFPAGDRASATEGPDDDDEGATREAGALRPGQRARRLRLRLRGGHRGAEVPRHRTAGPPGPRQPRASRRRRRREEHRRRRRNPPPEPRRLPAQGGSPARHRVAAPRPLRGRDGLPALRRAEPDGLREEARGSGAVRGAARAGLARRPVRRLHAGRHGQGQPAGDPPGVRGRGRRSRRRHGLRAQALRDPPPHPEVDPALQHPGAAGVLRGEPLRPDRRLQGHAQRRPAPRLLPGPVQSRDGIGHRHGALPVLHQHLPQLVPRPPVPVHLPQRRDQHAAGQHQLDARAPEPDGVEALRRRPQEGPHRGRHRRLRLGHVRQRARAPAPLRALAAARHDDDGPGALGQARVDEPGEEGLLRVPLLPDGALGRPGLHRLHRRRDGRAPRSTATACVRPATTSPTTAWWSWPPRWASSTSRSRT